MAPPRPRETSGKLTMPQDGTGARDPKPGERHCAFCGGKVSAVDPAIERFGEVFCCEGHAEEFVREVRTVRAQAAALPVRAPDPEAEHPEPSAAGALKQRGWTRYLKTGACCGAPLLALVVLAGGGGALLGAAGALLPILAALACPLGMYFMMRSMSKMGRENPDDKGEKK